MTEQHSELYDSAQSYWVVIPAYNEAATVRDVALRARQQCANVIVVDDGSTDGTDKALTGLDVTVLRNEENLGKAGSLWKGFQHALAQGAAGVITLDADGQHAPEEIPLFLAAAAQDSSLFLLGARRRDQRRAWFWRYFANRVADFWIGWAAGFPVEDSQSGFRLYPTVVLQGVAVPYDRARSFVFESEIVIEAVQRGFSCRSVPVTVLSRSGPRPSHFRPLDDIAGITRMVAWRILSAGFNPSGLWRVLRRAEPLSDPHRVLRAPHEQKTERR
ncbi:MAG: glycosyltransferase family 2 protein [Nitrospira sp.]|nr:glycosyltransferase family 2 protein [Nitrospira sp.]